MYVFDHQKGDLSDIIHSATHTIQSETDHDRWKFLEDSGASFQQLPTNDFDTNSNNNQDSLLHGGDQILVDQNVLSIGDENMRRSNDIFSRVVHLSPVKQSEMVLGHGDRISSPYIPGVKRRKSLPRKVVCIPAPGHTNTSSSGRASSGEVVPCDLWAWRKYGQKPIKGSPYPRGYYRCSSSKGCAARKQVERSRTDPNMLVITYTSEHNHPWPTQRNALAGSTRSSYPSKHPKPSPSTNSNPNSNPNSNSNSNSKDTNKTSTSTSNSSLTVVKEEASDIMGRANGITYDACMENDDLFADLAELESDPMSLLFEKSEVANSGKNCKGFDDDAFDDMFDWGQSSFVDHSTQ